MAAAEGGPGTGYGIVGGFAALAVGLVAMVLGGLALARSRRIAPGPGDDQPVGMRTDPGTSRQTR
nr:hypothetical protein GCM10020093_017620 [Planobispora longispora]